jgi:hypothetical protein
MIGSGKLFHIKTFVQDIYEMNGLDFHRLVSETNTAPIKQKLIMAKVDWNYTYQNLLEDTQKDIVAYKRG